MVCNLEHFTHICAFEAGDSLVPQIIYAKIVTTCMSSCSIGVLESKLHLISILVESCCLFFRPPQVADAIRDKQAK